MRAYLDSPDLKKSYLAVARQHQELDRYAKGLYWDAAESRGCAVGCWTRDPNGGHAGLAAEMGVPEELLRLADGLFEALPEPDYKAWPSRFAKAIPTGSELKPVGPKLLRWMVFDRRWGLLALADLRQTHPVLAELDAFLSWESQGFTAPRSVLAKIKADMQRLNDEFSAWRPWSEYARKDVRAEQALAKVLQAPLDPARGLEQAAWACRAAWQAQEAYGRAQAEAFLDFLAGAPGQVI